MPDTILAYVIQPEDVGLPGTFTNLAAVISSILPMIVALAGLAAFAFLAFGGFKYITSGGDDKALQEAKKVITNAILGLGIVFISFWLIRIIETVLGLKITGL